MIMEFYELYPKIKEYAINNKTPIETNNPGGSKNQVKSKSICIYTSFIL